MRPGLRRRRWARAAIIAICGLLWTAGAWAQEGVPADDDNDPWEGMNRSIFAFNDALDRWILQHVATGWNFVFPPSFQRSIRNVSENAAFPVVFANDLLQLRLGDSVEDMARFTVNTTVGLGGLFDPATHWGLENNDEDFGQTLGHWGVPAGPYLMLPLMGPSNPRDLVGRVADAAARVHPYFLGWAVNLALGATDVVNRRSLLDETIREERAQAFDLYASIRNAYVSLRENQIRESEAPKDEPDDDFYFFEDDEHEDGAVEDADQ
jgi:phospholipid-binding lipoprotein MlaA